MTMFPKLFGGAILITLLSPAVTQAVILNPGSGVVPAAYEAEPVGGTQVGSLVSPFSSSSFSGTMYTSVVSGDTSNPFGGLTFTYNFALTGGPQTLNTFTVTSFLGYLTDVSYFSSGVAPAVNPTTFRRVTAGDTIRFEFNEVSPGQQSALLVIQTSANQFVPSIGGVINGSPTEVNLLAPALIPEPTVMALGLLGAATLLIRRKS